MATRPANQRAGRSALDWSPGLECRGSIPLRDGRGRSHARNAPRLFAVAATATATDLPGSAVAAAYAHIAACTGGCAALDPDGVDRSVDAPRHPRADLEYLTQFKVAGGLNRVTRTTGKF